MKKTVMGIVVLGATGMAHAQSSVTIYGAADIGYVKQTETKAGMGETDNNRLGFMGTEDLGNGLKATFQLEHRFTLFDGEKTNGKTFEGASNVGLKGNFGQVRFGRVNELSTETYRVIDPFEQYGVGSMFKTHLRGDNLEGRISNTVRYDSPNLKGFQLGASYSLKNGSKSYVNTFIEGTGGPDMTFNGYEPYANNGYALSTTYVNGPLYLAANYNMAVSTNKSYNWNVGGAYSFGPARISAGYEQTKDKFLFGDVTWDSWLVGLSYKIGAGAINASYGQRKLDRNFGGSSPTDKKYAIGYTHNLSKRTSVYIEASQTKYGSPLGMLADYIADIPRAEEMLISERDKVNAVAIGMTHKF